MDTARLRKTFKYPSEDEESDGSRDELDEEGNSNISQNIPFWHATQSLLIRIYQNKNLSSPSFMLLRPSKMRSTASYSPSCRSQLSCPLFYISLLVRPARRCSAC